MKNINQKGFTMIELMTIVTITGIITSISIPNFITMETRAKDASVKNNIHTVQLAVENYKTANNSMKPDTLNIDVPSNMINPYNTARKGNLSIDTQALAAIPMTGSAGNPGGAGQIGYTKNIAGNPDAGYVITATGGDQKYILVVAE